MKISLEDWDFYDVARVLDTESGVATIDPVSPVVHGVVAVVDTDAGKAGWQVVAVYESSGELILQIDKRRWNLDRVELVHETLAEGSLCSFAVVVDGVREFEAVYASYRMDPLNQADPSFDDLDEVMQDMFLWLARVAWDERWRTAATQHWAEGLERRRRTK